MHFNFDFSATQILWTLTFAAVLVLLVVLLGRDRARRFPFFTASIATMGLLLLATQLLLSRLPRITGTVIYLAMSDLDFAIVLLVVVELARRAFGGAGKIAWLIGTLVLLAGAAVVLVLWGPWPSWTTMTIASELATIRLMDLIVDKGSLLSGVLTIELGVLITLFGRRFGAGRRSHVQGIVAGLSTASLAQLALRGILEAIGNYTRVQTPSDYDRVMDVRDKLIHANNVLYLCVLIWWIVWLWRDEPGTAHAGNGGGLAVGADNGATAFETPVANPQTSPEDAKSQGC